MGTVLCITHQKTKRLGQQDYFCKIGGKSFIINTKNVETLPLSQDSVSFLKDFLSENKTLEAKTSGSTGSPKTILLIKNAMRASAKNTLDFLNIKPNEKILLCLSAHHIAGKMMLVRWLVGGLDLYETETSATPLDEITGAFDFAAMVPYQAQQSLNQLHRIRKIILGGGGISLEFEKELLEIPSEIFHTYGMTETLSHVAMRKIDGKSPQVFTALPNVEFSLDERNCLIINASHIGVKNLMTNDVVELMDAQHFIWKGRIDNVVNSAGVKLFPEEIEKKIGDIGRDYFLAGVPDEKLGEKLVMVVEGEFSEAVEKQVGTINFLKYEKPKELLFVKYFKKTANGKIIRDFNRSK